VLYTILRCSLTSPMTHDDGGSTHLWNVGGQLFYTAVYPRRHSAHHTRRRENLKSRIVLYLTFYITTNSNIDSYIKCIQQYLHQMCSSLGVVWKESDDDHIGWHVLFYVTNTWEQCTVCDVTRKNKTSGFGSFFPINCMSSLKIIINNFKAPYIYIEMSSCISHNVCMNTDQYTNKKI
jgi:hypothetical protein